MSWLYVAVIWAATLVLADDIGLGNIHPVRGCFIMGALLYNVMHILYWKGKKKGCK